MDAPCGRYYEIPTQLNSQALYGDTHHGMSIQHRALIHWSPQQLQQGLPATVETIDPAWLDDATPRVDEGWSLVCFFDSPPARQGSPSLARVRFLVDEAPHDRLHPGARLRLIERATQALAQVEILD